MGQEDGNADVKEVTDDLPASTVDMLKPDGFQFYTVDEKGQLITRQMTDAEIQSIIAAAGGPLPIGALDPQKPGKNATEESKVREKLKRNIWKYEFKKTARVFSLRGKTKVQSNFGAHFQRIFFVL